MAFQCLSCLDHRERLRGVDAKRFEKLGRQNFTDRPFQRQPAIGRAGKGSLSRPFCAKVENPSIIGAKLGKQKTAAIAKVRVVMAELMTMIAERQRGPDIAGKRIEFSEMRNPFSVIKPIKPDCGGCPVIAPAQDVLRKTGGLDPAIEAVIQLKMDRRGAALGHLAVPFLHVSIMHACVADKWVTQSGQKHICKG